MKISEYTKGDEILIAFPKGVPPVNCKFLKTSNSKAKVQVQKPDGKLMWYGVECVVARGAGSQTEEVKTVQAASASLEEAMKHEAESVEEIEPKLAKAAKKLGDSIEKESSKAVAKLDKINKLKKAENRVDKKPTLKSQIIPLIKSGVSNKEISENLGCDYTYVADTRIALYKNKEISEKIYNARFHKKTK